MSIIGGILGLGMRGALWGAKTAGRGILGASRGLVEGTVSAGYGLAGKKMPEYLGRGVGAKAGAWVGSTGIPGAAQFTAGFAEGTGRQTLRMGGNLARDVGTIAHGTGAALFKPAVNSPVPYVMRGGAQWALATGAIGAGAALGYRDVAQQRRIGRVHPYGHMDELSHDGHPPNMPRQDMGATGDLVLALNNMR